MSIPTIETALWVDRLVRRHPRTLRVLAGLLVMAALFAVLLAAAGPAHARLPAGTEAVVGIAGTGLALTWATLPVRRRHA